MSEPQQPMAQPIGEVVGVLVRCLRALGNAGRPVEASRLAARAWWLLQESAPAAAEHVNGVMHYLARLPEEAAQPTAAPKPRTVIKETQHVPGS